MVCQAMKARQHEGRLAVRGARTRRNELRRVLHFQLLRYLVAVGPVAARDRAELAERFKLPNTNATNSAFLTSVKALLDDLGRMVSAHEATIEAGRTGRRDHIGATADLSEVTAELQENVRLLVGITRWFLYSPAE